MEEACVWGAVVYVQAGAARGATARRAQGRQATGLGIGAGAEPKKALQDGGKPVIPITGRKCARCYWSGSSSCSDCCSSANAMRAIEEQSG